MGVFDPDELEVEARRQTGLEDLGDDSHREGLVVLAGSLDAEADLTDLGREALRGTIVAALANRLRVVDWRSRHPEVTAEPVDHPMIVIGMFRAGTTFLSNLLDQDPANRALLRWEAGDSVPPVGAAEHRRGWRVDAAQAGNDMLESLNPAIRSIHHEDADGPTECISVMSQDFKSLSWEAIANVPSYGDWLRHVDQRSAYRYHRDVLQVLQSGGVRGRWTLKSPHHAVALESLIAVYPDARLVLLHRDPIVLCASVCSLIGTLSATFSDADHRRYIAQHWTRMLEDCVERVDAFRAAHPDHPIIDIAYDDLVREPLDTVAALYAALGRELDGPAREAMAAYVAAHPKGSLGTHRYDLAGLGLDPADLAERFAAYTAQQSITPEPAAT